MGVVSGKVERDRFVTGISQPLLDELPIPGHPTRTGDQEKCAHLRTTVLHRQNHRGMG
jgi:hypothetical protein